MQKQISLDEINSAVNAALIDVEPLIKQIGDNPETGYQEKFACKLQMDFLTEAGFAPEAGAGDVLTYSSASLKFHTSGLGCTASGFRQFSGEIALKCLRISSFACSRRPLVWNGLTAQPIMKLSE